jgi:hypothetical protein
VELLNTRMQSMGLEPVTGPQSLEIQDESNRQFLDDIRHAYTIAFGYSWVNLLYDFTLSPPFVLRAGYAFFSW